MVFGIIYYLFFFKTFSLSWLLPYHSPSVYFILSSSSSLLFCYPLKCVFSRVPDLPYFLFMLLNQRIHVHCFRHFLNLISTKTFLELWIPVSNSLKDTSSWMSLWNPNTNNHKLELINVPPTLFLGSLSCWMAQPNFPNEKLLSHPKVCLLPLHIQLITRLYQFSKIIIRLLSILSMIE